MLQIDDIVIPEQDIGEVIAIEGEKRVFTVRGYLRC